MRRLPRVSDAEWLVVKVLWLAPGQTAEGVVEALQGQRGRCDFVVVPRADAQELDSGEYELLIVDVDEQPERQMELLSRCRRLYPHVPVLVLVREGDTSAAVAAMKAGAADCLEKPLVPDRLRSAVMAVLGQGRPSCPPACRALTGMETQVLHLLLAGKTNVEIAAQFHRSRRTIEAHRRNIMRKLGAAHVSDLVKQAFRMNYIGSGAPAAAPLAERTDTGATKRLEPGRKAKVVDSAPSGLALPEGLS
jgi:two-component system response regulator FixJ